MKLTPDGQKLVVARFGGVALVDVDTGKVLREFVGHATWEHVNAVAVSVDGELAISAVPDPGIPL